jgi:catechol 2,3-dioxygenase-like lactoylglutathione lyase family enzyme
VITTWGLTHVALAVRDPDRAARFYEEGFGAVRVYADAGFADPPPVRSPC